MKKIGPGGTCTHVSQALVGRFTDPATGTALTKGLKIFYYRPLLPILTIESKEPNI